MMPKQLYGTRGALLAGVAVLASACSTDSPTSPSELKATKPVAALAAISCTGSVSSKTISCAAASDESDLRGNLIVGGQGVYVRLSADPTTVPGPNTVTITNVRVQNLMAKALGTVDGVVASTEGVRVFFQDLGNVEPVNPDGYADYTGSHQAYYALGGPLASGELSSGRSWTLQLAPGTTTYTFTVYVVGAMQPDNEYLRWANTRPAGTITYNGVFGVQGNEVFIVGSAGNVLRYDGSNYTESTISASNLNDVWGNARDNVYAVGNLGAFRFDGLGWSPITLPAGSQSLWDVDGTTSSDVLISGMGNGSRASVYAFNGSSWSSTMLPATATGNKVVAYGVWRDRASSFAVAVGNAGGIWHRVGGVWTAAASPVTTALQDVWGTSASNIYAVGVGGVVLHYDGTSWSQLAVPVTGTPTLWSVYGTNANNIYISGHNSGSAGTILRWDGTYWRSETSPSTGINFTGVYMAGGTGGEPYAVGTNGAVYRGVR